jgi:mannose-1-phosphate guanylyltransferase
MIETNISNLSLENEGKIPVVLIEAQVGEYTGEDDIVRIDDDFKRFNK